MEIRTEGSTLFLDDRQFSELDLFVCRILDILSVYSPYVIVSGYVAILFGRTRSTEDVDILIPVCEQSTFLALYNKLLQSDYEFLNAEDGGGLFSMLLSGSGIRLCDKDLFIPNMEIKFIKNESDDYSFQNRIQLKIAERTFFSALWRFRLRINSG